MKQMKKYLVLVLIFAMGISILPMNVNAAKKAKLSKTKVTMQVGKTVQLKVKNNKKRVKWSSSNKKVATVSKKGKVKAVSSGNARIIAKISKKKLVCKVNVKRTITNKDNDTNKDTSQSNDGKVNPNVTPTEKPAVTIPTSTPAVTPTAAPIATSTATPTTTPTATPAVTPTSTPVVEPTTPTLDSIVENYKTLKTYIQNNGKTQQSGGNKYIQNYINEFMYTIEFDNEEEVFVFSTYCEIDLSNGGNCRNLLTVEVKENDLRNGDLEFITLFSNGASAILTLTDSMEKLDFNSPLDWKVVDHTGLDEDSWKEQADVFGGLSYLGWDILLDKTVKMNLTDLGFGVAI